MAVRRLLVAAAVLASARPAGATDIFEFPGYGSESLSRSGAFVARATNPLATFENPAGLAGQKTGVLANVHLVFNDVCFTREGAGSTVDDYDVKYPADVCDETALSPLPAIGGVLAVTDRLGVGLAVMPPNVYGNLAFPETVDVPVSAAGQTLSRPVPSPQRYMLLEQSGVLLNPTIGVGYEAAPGVRVGAGFVWGMGSLQLRNANMSIRPTCAAADCSADPLSWRDPRVSDVLAEFDVADWFIPGFVLGAIYSPIRELDVGFSLFVQEAFDGHGDLTTKASYWTNTGVSDNPVVGKSSDVESGLGHFRLPNPLEIRLGARFHWPRDGAAPMRAGAERDPIADDLFDVELDVSYTRNSAYDAVQLRFPEQPAIEVQGTGGLVPRNNDVELAIKGDTVGLRLGGEYVALPNRLAIRAGAWWEPDVQRPEYLNVTVIASQRIGLSGGVAVRLGQIDVEAGYMHVFFDAVDNGGDGRVLAVSGLATENFRSPYAINGGKVTQSANIVSLGATARF